MALKMRSHRSWLALLVGTGLGFFFAFATGVRAAREPVPAPVIPDELRPLSDVLERVKRNYVDPVDDDRLLKLAVRGMVSGLDPYSTLLDANEFDDLRAATKGVYTGIGVEIAVADGEVRVVATVEDSPADHAGLRNGDVLVAIDGHELRVASLAEAAALLRGEEGTLMRLTVEREAVKEPLQFAVRCGRVNVRSVREELLAPGVGYLSVRSFSHRTVGELRKAVSRLTATNGRSLSGLVLDLRNNPGGEFDAATGTADLFLDAGIIVKAAGRTPKATFTVEAKPGDVLHGAPLVVLVNAGSASASEIVAGALHDHRRAVLVGRTTFGKGSVQTLLPLPGGQALKRTTSHYHTPSGVSIHERGIRPDVMLTRTDTEPHDADDSAPLIERDGEVRAALAILTGAAVPYAGLAGAAQ